MKEFTRLVRIMKKLRHPRRGCPWDLKQTPHSLKEYILEEAHELIEAIDGGDADAIREELGDLLLQIVFLAQLAAEKEAVLHPRGARRHQRQAGPPPSAHLRQRQGRRRRRGQGQLGADQDRRERTSRASFPTIRRHALPAAGQSHRLAGFRGRVRLERRRKGARQGRARRSANCAPRCAGNRLHEAEEEIGDLLFAVANVARLLKINPEFALARDQPQVHPPLPLHRNGAEQTGQGDRPSVPGGDGRALAASQERAYRAAVIRNS